MPAEVVADIEHQIATAVAQAVDAQRASVRQSMRAQGLTKGLTAAGAKPNVWDHQGWVRQVDRHVGPVATKAAARIVQTAKAALPLAVAAGAPIVASALAAHVVNSVLAAGDRIGGTLSNAADDGLEAVDDALDSAAGWVGALAGRLAIGLANWAGADLASHAARQSTQPVTVTWNAVGDDHTRADHADADGQTVNAGDTFSVGGEDLAFPGDPSGSDENTVGCRCWLTTDGIDDPSDSGDDGGE